MHSAFRVIALFSLSLPSLLAQRIIQPATSQLEALENFAKQPTAVVTWSKEVGRIDTDQANAVITALIVQDAGQTPQQMRGIRIDLTEGDIKDEVYTREDLLGRLVMALNQISDGMSRYLSRVRTSGCFGSGIFWQQPGHAFAASQCVLSGWEGLSVTTGTASFRFTGAAPYLFAGAITRGKEELQSH